MERLPEEAEFREQENVTYNEVFAYNKEEDE